MTRRTVGIASLVGAGLWSFVETSHDAFRLALPPVASLVGDAWVLFLIPVAVSALCLSIGLWMARRGEREPLTCSSSASAWELARTAFGTVTVVRAAVDLAARPGVDSAFESLSGSPLDTLALGLSGISLAEHALAHFALTTTFGSILVLGPERLVRWLLRTFGGASSSTVDDARPAPPSA